MRVVIIGIDCYNDGVNKAPAGRAAGGDVMKPKLYLAKSYVMTCAACGHWMGRWPQFFGDGMDGKGDSCEKCGNTSVNIREGRPYGRKSKQWEWVESEFQKLWRFMQPEYDDDTVECLPSLPELRQQMKCPVCEGTGYHQGWNCDRCMSTGILDPDEEPEKA